MKYSQEIIDTELNNEIISDEIYDGKPVEDITDHVRCITYATYHKDALEKVADACTHIYKGEGKKLYLLLEKYEFLFNVTLSIWNTDPIGILLR